jgi:hypothetical protein
MGFAPEARARFQTPQPGSFRLPNERDPELSGYGTSQFEKRNRLSTPDIWRMVREAVGN